MKPTRVAIGVPALNGGALFRELLAAVRGQVTAHEVSLHVCDSGSTDGTVAAALEAGADVFAYPAGEPFRHGRARNLLAGRAAGDFVVLLTQDAVPTSPGWLDALLRPFDNEIIRIAGVYARHLPRPGAAFWERQRTITSPSARESGWTSFLAPGTALSDFTPAEQVERCRFDNVCSAIRREAWEKYPFPDIPFGEDIVWARTVIAAGLAIRYEPEATVYHSHDRDMAYDFQRNYQDARVLYEHFGFAAAPDLPALGANLINAAVSDLVTLAVSSQEPTAAKLRAGLTAPVRLAAAQFGALRGAWSARKGKKSPFDGKV